MPVFSIFELRCCICGRVFDSSGQYKGPSTCGRECWREYQWRMTLSILGQDYYPDPSRQDVASDTV